MRAKLVVEVLGASVERNEPNWEFLDYYIMYSSYM